MILLASNEDGNISSNPPPAHSPFRSASAGPFGAVFPAVWGALWSGVSSGVGCTLVAWLVVITVLLDFQH